MYGILTFANNSQETGRQNKRGRLLQQNVSSGGTCRWYYDSNHCHCFEKKNNCPSHFPQPHPFIQYNPEDVDEEEEAEIARQEAEEQRQIEQEIENEMGDLTGPICEDSSDESVCDDNG